MKVLQVNCVYPVGSTGKIVQKIHNGLCEKGVSSLVCYGRGADVHKEHVYKTCSDFYARLNNGISRFTGLLYGGCRRSTNRLITIIKKEKPDVVHLHCINGHFVNIYRLVQWLKENQIKTVLTNHAEFFYTANCDYAYDCDKWMSGCGNCPDVKKATKSILFDKTAKSYQMMKDAFSGFGDRIVITSVSPWIQGRAEQSKIFEGLRHVTVFNGVDVDTFRIWPKEDVYKEHRESDKKVVFHVSSDFNDKPGNRKGGFELLELAKRMIDQPVVFCVAAARCELSGPVPENVVILGNVADQKMLAKYYGEADLTLVTSKRETFSMPCAESLCCGTPVVGFRAGAPEQISIPEYSEFVTYGDLEGLKEAVLRWINRKDLDRETVSKDAMKIYSNKQMVASYMEIYGEL